MSVELKSLPAGQGVKPVPYPDSDGKPMADNTRQARWIIVLYGNLTALLRTVPDVLIAADLLWYARPEEGEKPTAPDVMVVFGRPRGDRGSYKQWEEGNVPVTVAFEVLSPSNTVEEMADKLAFYDEHGVEEYYVYNPDKNTLLVYLRGQAALRRIVHQGQYTSPRLGIRFDLSGPEMAVSYPDGRRFLSFEELDTERQRQEQRADQAEQRAARLAELSRKARRQQATPQELEELERLETESFPGS